MIADGCAWMVAGGFTTNDCHYVARGGFRGCFKTTEMTAKHDVQQSSMFIAY